jgi:flavin-dependent dehydrogenase
MSARTIEIVGGGVAGLSLGIALRRAGVPVAVFEAMDYPRHRTCGEFISGLDAETIEELALSSVLREFPRCSRVAWFGRARAPRRWELPAPAILVSRYDLDARLSETFCNAGGRLETKSRVTANEGRPGLVFATGRRAERTSSWLGLKVHVTGLALAGDLEFHTGNHAYVGLCAVGGGRVNVCGLFRRRKRLVTNRTTALADYVRASGMSALAERLAHATPLPESICAIAGIRFGRQPRTSDRVELGDAFAVTPPFTGNGMAMAFQSAACALQPLVAWSRGFAEWPSIAEEISDRHDVAFRRRLRLARGIHPFLLGPVAARVADMLNRLRLTPLPWICRYVH